MDVGSEGVAGQHVPGNQYLRLRGPVALGFRFNEWQVCWYGVGPKYRMFYLVMVVRVRP